jgi:hypothetical protein
LGRRSVLSWKFGDFLEAAGLKQNRWRERTGISAFDPPSGSPIAVERAPELADPFAGRSAAM